MAPTSASRRAGAAMPTTRRQPVVRTPPSLAAGTHVLSSDGTAYAVDAALAAAFRPGDRVVAAPSAGLLHIPAAEQSKADAAVAAAHAAFAAMHGVADAAIVAFYHHAAAALEDDAVWQRVAAANAKDVAAAKRRGRSTTRLEVSAAMRANMVAGLRGWAKTPSRRGAVLETVRHEGFRVEMVGAALGVVAFVFEGRPNVLADACGVLRGGNTVVFRIGSDALGTARAIMELAIAPALASAGLPAGAVTLVDSAAHAAGWALFLDRRLSLAVARGSGAAVATLGELARSVGTPASLHGTGGAWIVASAKAPDADLHQAVVDSLDRKVCNTLNTLCIVTADGRGSERAAIALAALAEAGERRDTTFRLHVAAGSEALVPAELFAKRVPVMRASGTEREPQAEAIAEEALGTEWEWEHTPEISLVAVPSVEAAVALFNALSPRLVGCLVSADAAEQERFFATLDAPFVGDGYSRWVDGQFALGKPELGLSNWEHGRLFARGGVLTGDSVYTVRTRYVQAP